jgi:hypothetical protein
VVGCIQNSGSVKISARRKPVKLQLVLEIKPTKIGGHGANSAMPRIGKKPCSEIFSIYVDGDDADLCVKRMAICVP